MSDALRRNLALFSIGIVQKLTELSARQIRYYEQHHLIHPVRTEGNQRLFSFNDVERLLEIKKLMDEGLNISKINSALDSMETHSELLNHSELPIKKEQENTNEISEQEVRDLLKQELAEIRMNRRGAMNSLIQGELTRFFR